MLSEPVRRPLLAPFDGYRTCYYRTFGVGSATPSQQDAYAQAREWMDASTEAIRIRRDWRRRSC
jgi:Xaa-Pro aminopeptidase